MGVYRGRTFVCEPRAFAKFLKSHFPQISTFIMMGILIPLETGKHPSLVSAQLRGDYLETIETAAREGIE